MLFKLRHGRRPPGHDSYATTEHLHSGAPAWTGACHFRAG